MQTIKRVNLENFGKIFNKSIGTTINNFSNNTIKKIESLAYSAELPYDDGIFGPEAIEGKYFGGNQGYLTQNCADFLKNRKVWEIVQKYYPEADSEDLELLFYRMNSVGCGYIAVINTLLFEAGIFKNKYDFDSVFGFPYFGSNGYGYDYLFLDFFLYIAKEQLDFQTIEEVYGNTAEQMKYYESEDLALTEEEFQITGMKGLLIRTAGHFFKEYLLSKGIKIDGGIIMSQKLDNGMIIGTKLEDAIEMVSNNLSLQMIVGAKDFTLYYPYDKDGNGVLDDIAQEDVGAHAMTVVGKTDDPNKVIVSSWGREYLIDINDIDEYYVLDYSNENGYKSEYEYIDEPYWIIDHSTWFI